MMESSTLPRLLHAATGRPLTLQQHEAAFASPSPVANLFEELQSSGLTGRGGGTFATSKKVALLRSQRSHHKYVVVNAMEGEPAAHKDQTLLSSNPHLVLDGAEYLATMIGAKEIAVCVSRDNPQVVHHVQRAIHERQRRSERGPRIELHAPPWRYVAGEESALIHWLNDNESLPQYRANRAEPLRIGRGPALVNNAETCAHVALIGRFGSAWFRQLGTEESTGSTLVSLSGAVERPSVLEVPLGTSLRSILTAGHAHEPQALLTGGYGGAWLSGAHVDVAYDNAALAAYGATVGAGILVVLGRNGCGLSETQRIVKWMANESARQCGPCAFGLPALADDLTQLLRPTRDPRAVHRELVDRCNVIEGRGACRHPDGVVRLVRSALYVFRDDIAQHVQGVHCVGSRSREFFVKVPTLEREDELIWQ